MHKTLTHEAATKLTEHPRRAGSALEMGMDCKLLYSELISEHKLKPVGWKDCL